MRKNHHLPRAGARLSPTEAIWSLVLIAIGLTACTRDRAPSNTDGSSPDSVTSPSVARPDSAWVVTATAYGALRLGVPVSEVAAILVDTARPSDESCGYVVPPSLPESVSVMIVNDTAIRVDIRSGKVRTAEGAGIGDTEQRIHDLYRGRVRVEPHKYTDGRYLIVTPTAPADSAFRLVFETDGARVVNYRAGRLPSVLWVEGCS